MKTYLGDGVYAEHDGFGVWLTTEREDGEHRIYLEPSALKDLNEFMRRQHHERDQDAPTHRD